MVELTSSSWCSIDISPLVLLVMTACAGSLVREIHKLATWYGHIYKNNTEGVGESWGVRLAVAVEHCSASTTSVETMDTYKVVLPNPLQHVVPFSGELHDLLLK